MTEIKSAFVYTPDTLNYNFGPSHPFRPERSGWTFTALEKAGLFHREFEPVKPAPASREELELFHTPAYVDALFSEDRDRLLKFGIGPGDNPFFPGLSRACAAVAGCTLTAMKLLLEGDYRAAFSFPGGLHHAHPEFAYGFCLVNDIAIAIRHALNSLPSGKKIFYLDLDAHFGDGVVYGFYESGDVVTVSVHESGNYLFPGTGFSNERGRGEGLGLKLNIPLPPYSGDEQFLTIFSDVIVPLIEHARPLILIVQFGTDGYRDDPLTHLGCSGSAYLEVVKKLRDILLHSDTRLLMTGGGGYVPWFASAVWFAACSIITSGKLTPLPEGTIPGLPPGYDFPPVKSLLPAAHREEWTMALENALRHRDEMLNRLT